MERKTHVLILCLASTLLAVILYRNAKFPYSHHTKKPATSNKIISPQTEIPDNFKALYQKNIAQREYHITWDKEKECLQSPNRKQNLRAYYQPGVLKVQNRVDSAGNNFQLTLTTEGIYADGKKLHTPSKNSPSEISDNRLLLKHPGFTEEYINNEQGIRQNFIVESAPSGTRKLQVRLSPSGMHVDKLSDNTLEFYSEKAGRKTNQLTYDSLKCWDANGKNLAATLAFQNGQIHIDVDVHKAAYPVTIDPIMTSGNPANPGNADLVLEGFQAGAQFGTSVSSAGDVNGDGFSDVIVGAPYYFDNEVNQGAFFLFLGSSDGLQTNGYPFAGPAVQDAYFGKSVSTAGDVNGDGFSDVIIGAPGSKAAYVYYGSASGLVLVPLKIDIAQTTAGFGGAVNVAGDIDNDGFSDVVVGAKSFSNGQAITGAAFIFKGSQAGLGTIPSDTLLCNDPGAEFGHAVASAGDINGDGYSDLIIGAPYYHTQPNVNAGGVFIYNGSSSGIVHTPATTLPGKHALSRFGFSVSSAGDYNGDGFSDILVGSNTYKDFFQNEGAIFLYLANGNGYGIDPQKEHIVKGGQEFGQRGESVACAGDINGDGYSDVLYGTRFANTGSLNDPLVGSGRVSCFHGTRPGYIAGGDGELIKELLHAGAELGTSVASAGDVNGDGYSDIIAGAPMFDRTGVNDGAVLFYYGLPALTITKANISFEGDQENGNMGSSLSSAGDINGDGFDDLIIGAPYYDNGQQDEGMCFLYYGSANGIDPDNAILIEMNQTNATFGYSLSGAGDVNGDGYDDIIIGARSYTMPGFQFSGAAFVFYGSSAGIQLGATNVVYIPKAAAGAGQSVSGAGDINGDGYDDVIVGASNYTGDKQQEGAIMVALGSASGIQSGSGTIIESNQAHSDFGVSMSGAGDVNGDGYADIIVGAPGFAINANADEGACFVYYGTKTGINTNQYKILSLPQNSDDFGTSVSKAGDVNGDGYSDIVVGAPEYSTQMGDGAVAIYYGASIGLSEANSTILTSNQQDSDLGNSVAGADMNGDGYSDILAGSQGYDNPAINQGAVFIYPGSENGAGSEPIMLERIGAVVFGTEVASAGDINGDGYQDLILSAAYEKQANFDNGVIYVFYGNADRLAYNHEKLRNNVNLYNSNLTSNLTQTNTADSKVGIGLSGKSFLGRNKSKMVWEIREPGQSFSHNSPITNSTQFTGEGNFTGSQFQGQELKTDVDKGEPFIKLRARIKFHPTLAITGQVYGPWRYADRTIITNEQVFPVELISFSAEVIENQVQLSWATATEVNSNYFEIQRSNNGKAWEKIGEVPALQNSSSNHHYTFSDANPLKGTSYYRLKIVDLDATFAYSHIDSVNIKSKLTFYPNPTSGPLQIEADEPVIEISVYDSSGIKVMSLQNVQGLKSVNLGQLPAGKYLVQVNGRVVHIVKK
ncbi:FG-GAP-like repeat-containing protein [Dyadobacter bucti]|uniref:FG-GAP-like repeat-containing protein n=1 Tax=Dyadobacter bucti TaxID=2572203 RepID=UPI001108A44A|nr:FG-GAP-like repeat-containing protein [Dyadobacter bucti]